MFERLKKRNFCSMGSGFPYCGYLEPEDFFGTDYADYTDWLRVFGGMGIEKKLSGGRVQ